MRTLNASTYKGFAIFCLVCIFAKKWLDKLFMSQYFFPENEVIFLFANLLSLYFDVEEENTDPLSLRMVGNQLYQLTSQQSINFLHCFLREVFLCVPSLLKIYDF